MHVIHYCKYIERISTPPSPAKKDEEEKSLSDNTLVKQFTVFINNMW